MSTEPQAIPEGYKVNSRGNLDRISSIKDIDLERDKLVAALIRKAKFQSEVIGKFKATMFQDVYAFIQHSADEYNVKIGGKKGNVTLRSYDAKQRILISVAENIVFDERLQVAKAIIDECLNDWAHEAHENIRTIITDAFKVDSEGRISTGQVLGLRKYKFNDERWDTAMQAITDAISVINTKEYIRFYETDENGKEHAISLDIASL